MQKAGSFDLVFCGRQAIDGDTAQVGPQVAEKLGLPQITYAESIVELLESEIVVKTRLRTRRRVGQMPPAGPTYRGRFSQPTAPSLGPQTHPIQAGSCSERISGCCSRNTPNLVSLTSLESYLAAHNLKITVWSAADLDIDETQIGLAGSPTQVYKVNFVVLESTESKEIPADYAGIQALIQELIKEYIVG